MAVSLFVQITVQDFEAWKKNYDGAAQFMQQMGVIADTVHRNLDDPNSIIIAQKVSEECLQGYLAMLDGSQERRAEEGILSWTQWVGQSV